MVCISDCTVLDTRDSLEHDAHKCITRRAPSLVAAEDLDFRCEKLRMHVGTDGMLLWVSKCRSVRWLYSRALLVAYDVSD